jgi:hypothetical protein
MIQSTDIDFQVSKPIEVLESNGLSKNLSDEDIKDVIGLWQKEIEFLDANRRKTTQTFYADRMKLAKLVQIDEQMNEPGLYGVILRTKLQLKAFVAGSSISAIKKVNKSLIHHVRIKINLEDEFLDRTSKVYCKKMDALGALERYISKVNYYSKMKPILDFLETQRAIHT